MMKNNISFLETNHKPTGKCILEPKYGESRVFQNSIVKAELIEIQRDDFLLVRAAEGPEFECYWLENGNNVNIELELGDQLLCTPPSSDQELGIVLGRIGKYKKPQPQQNLTIEASETLTLKCGEASVELRKDGKAMLKGEDVLLRAKGTQRIRAGTVAIN